VRRFVLAIIPAVVVLAIIPAVVVLAIIPAVVLRIVVMASGASLVGDGRGLLHVLILSRLLTR
jgi:hypothetical protein